MWGPLLVIGGIVLAQAGAPGPDRDLAARVERLVSQLDAPQLKDRNAAEEELVRLGPDVLPLLTPNAGSSRPEVEVRLSRVRLKLQRGRAEASVEPSRITLHGEAVPLAMVLAEFQKQTGNKIVDGRRRDAGPTPDVRLKVDFDKTPFWPALDRVLDRAGLGLYPFGDDGAARIVAGDGPAGSRGLRAGYVGPFRFEAVGVVAQQDLRNPANRLLRVELEVAWEPRLRPVVFYHRMADVKAIDDRGRTIAVASRQADLEVPVSPGPIAKVLTIPLALPPREVGKIARLEGTLRALVPGQEEVFRFDDLTQTQGVEKRIAGATVLLEPLRKGDKGWEVSILVRFDRPEGALASHRNWILNNPAFLERRDGTKVLPEPLPETTQRDTAEIGIRYVFAAEGLVKDYAFVYRTPTAIFSTPLRYEVRDIPLP